MKVLTRDSFIFKAIPIVSVVLAIVVATITNPADYGLSPIVLRWIGLLSTIFAAVSGWLGTSPLPGTNDPNVIATRAGKVLALLIAVGLSGILMGCVAKTPIALPQSLPLAVNSTDAQLRAAAQRSTEMLAKAQELLVEVIKSEKAIEPSMSVEVKTQTRAVLHRINDGIVKGAQDIQEAAHTWQEISAAVSPVAAEVQRLVDLAGTLRQSGGFGGLAGELLTYVKSIIGAGGAPAPVAIGGVA